MAVLCLVLFQFFFLFLLPQSDSSAINRKPIVIVPGVMGSQLEARLHKANSSKWYCYKNYDEWYRLWLNLDDILPLAQNCFKENIKLHYNANTGEYTDTEGVDIRVTDFGNTSGIETLDPNIESASYFNVLVDYFVKLGYTRGVDLRAAPYDWRLGPAELLRRQYFTNLRTLIESTYSSQGNKKVTLLVHSMGALVSHYFLTRVVTETWKHTYLDQYVTLGGAWAGCAKALNALISGDTDQIFKLSNRLYVRPVERSFPSDYWLLPMPSNDTWNESFILVATPTASYSAYDLYKLIDRLNYPNGPVMYEGVVKTMPHPFSPPNITTHCIYGYDLQTAESFNFANLRKFPNGKPDVVCGKGDGTVSLRSLRLCQKWEGQQAWPVKSYEMKGAEHFGMLNDDDVLKIIENLVIVTDK